MTMEGCLLGFLISTTKLGLLGNRYTKLRFNAKKAYEIPAESPSLHKCGTIFFPLIRTSPHTSISVAFAHNTADFYGELYLSLLQKYKFLQGFCSATLKLSENV